MQPIGSQTRRHQSAGKRPQKVADISVGGRVLPRLLRKPARFFSQNSASKLFSNTAIRIALGLAVSLPAAGFFAIHNKTAGKMLASASSMAGFKVQNLVINGGQNLDRQALQFLLGSELEKSLFEFDVEIARKRIKQNSRVAEATVRKIYPNTVMVDIVEREPFALWKVDGVVNLISRDGAVIAELEDDHLALPQIVGSGANTAASEFLATMSRFPMLSARMGAYVRVAGRRWNLMMHEGTTILLPEVEWQSALGELYELQARWEILDRDLVQIDLRLADRLVVRMRPDTAQIRRAEVEEAIKQSKSTGHKI